MHRAIVDGLRRIVNEQYQYENKLLESEPGGVMRMASINEKGERISVAGDAVAGYFASGEDARRAIDALVERGFDVRQIGAAFHSRFQREPILPVEEEMERRISGQDDSVAGVASGSRAVTPSGLSTGGGMEIPGARRPGPITGAEIPPDLPREIPSELPTEVGVRAMGNRKVEAGEGHLGESSAPSYSSAAFEKSFTAMGIPPEHARRLAQALRRGGAVVTVSAGARAAEAETVLLQNHGIIRYQTPSGRMEPVSPTSPADVHLEIFGALRRLYSNYLPPERQIERKAS